MIGWIYIAENERIPDLVKVGFTTRQPDERMQEFSGTNVPVPYKCVYWALCDNPRHVEAQVHYELRKCRLNGDREFFECDADDAVHVIRHVLGDDMIREWSEAELSARMHAMSEAERKRREQEAVRQLDEHLKHIKALREARKQQEQAYLQERVRVARKQLGLPETRPVQKPLTPEEYAAQRRAWLANRQAEREAEARAQIVQAQPAPQPRRVPLIERLVNYLAGKEQHT